MSTNQLKKGTKVETSLTKGLVVGIIVGLVIGLISGYAVPLTRTTLSAQFEERISELQGQVTNLESGIENKEGQIINLEGDIEDKDAQITNLHLELNSTHERNLQLVLNEIKELADYSRWVFIPYPGNPVLDGDEPSEWDQFHKCSVSLVFVENHWVMYYEGGNHYAGSHHYQIGRATAPSPYGPWKKDPDNPILRVGEPGSWDEGYVAVPRLMQNKDGRWVLLYNGYAEGKSYNVGLAYATEPDGEWEKYEGNPVTDDIGRLNDVAYKDGVYYMFAGSLAAFRLYTATQLEGPWKDEGVVLRPQVNANRWNTEGNMELGTIIYQAGRFHWFFSTVLGKHPTGKDYSQGINYAWSEDLRNWHRGAINPVLVPSFIPSEWDETWLVGPSAIPWDGKLLLYMKAFSKSSGEGPLVLFVGLTPTIGGVISAPIIEVESLPPGGSTLMGKTWHENKMLRLEKVTKFALTYEGTFDSRAEVGARVSLFSSHDGVNFDTVPFTFFDVSPAERVVQKTVPISPSMLYAKVTVKNLSDKYSITDIKITTTVGIDNITSSGK